MTLCYAVCRTASLRSFPGEIHRRQSQSHSSPVKVFGRQSDLCLGWAKRWQVDVLEGLLISELAAARGVKRSASSSVKSFILDLNYVSVAPEEEMMM